jgi:HEAT repeat protein
MRNRTKLLLLFGLLALTGCHKEKSTDELIADLESGEEKERIIAVRLLQNRKGDAARVVPALIKALKDKDHDVRWGATIGLGYYGEQARDAIPALQERQHDPDVRVRRAAADALARIDPNLTPNKNNPK